MSYQSNTTLQQIVQKLTDARSVLITGHAKPDGDALGSAIALGRALQRMDKRVEYWAMPPVPENLAVLWDRVDLHLLNPGEPGPADEPDLVVIVDTGAWSQLEPMRPFLQARYDKTIVLDHHLRGDDVGRWRWVDASAAAACEIVADLIDLLPTEPDALINQALFVGIASDTGWFRFSNTSARTHELAARLQRAGVDHAMLYQQVEQGERPEKLALLIRALDSLKLLNGGTAAVMCLRTSDFDETGARPEETERFVDIPQIVRDVDVVALITEQRDGPVRISFRSKPGDGAIDVSALAGQFGGGGHARASGAKVDGSLETVQRRVIEAITRHLASTDHV